MTSCRLRRIGCGVIGGLAVLSVNGAVAADNYPNRPIRMMVAFPPGGPTDLVGRIVAQGLTESLGQQVVLDNRPGAGGAVAGTIMAHAAPDGYTLFTAANGEIAIAPNLYAKMQWDPSKDILPVSRVGASQLVLVVHPSFAAKTVKELIAMAKGKPASINFASSGPGSTAHLSSELLKAMTGIDIVHIPYKGAGPALTDVMAGQVHMLISGFSSAYPHVKSGKLRALAVTGAKRVVAVPDLPTIGETVPGYEVTSWYGLFVPARTPRPIINRLHRELQTLIRRPDMAERMVLMGIEPEGNTPEEFAAQLKEETARWGRVIKLAGVPKQ